MVINYQTHEENDKICFINWTGNDLSKVEESVMKIIHVLSLSLLLFDFGFTNIFIFFKAHCNGKGRIYTAQITTLCRGP